MDGIFNTLLQTTGGAKDILNAMEGNDLAAVVQAAIGAMKKTLSIPMRLVERKDADISNKFRKEGNLCYVNGEYKEAIILYNKALAYAPNASMELKLAYSNISAVLLAIKACVACQDTIKACYELDCPKFLTDKLAKRMNETHMYAVAEKARDLALHIGDVYLKSYLDFDVKRNPEVPCASEDVRVETTDDGTKKIVAARDIKAGTMVALERAFVSTQEDDRKYTSCYYCQRMGFFFIPCEGCSHALFCSEECRKKCLEEYHRIECHIVAFMGTMYVKPINKLAVRAAIKMSLELGWDKLRAASLEMGLERLKKSTVSEAFDASNPVSMLCYNDRKSGFPDKIFHGSLVIGPAIHLLTLVPGYFPEGANKRKKAIDALSRIMLHLHTTFTNRIEIMCSSLDVKIAMFKCGAQRNTGWFSFASKLAHSCEPNLFAMGLNDRVALVAVETIKKGDELTISYVSHFYESVQTITPTASRLRQLNVASAIQVHCECRVCTEEWHDCSHTPANLTPQQSKVYKKFSKLKARENFVSSGDMFKVAIETLDSLTGLNNTTQHSQAYGQLRSTLNLVQCCNGGKMNKGYEVQPVTKSYIVFD